VTIKTWLDLANKDAERRGLANLRPLLEGLARQTASLRAADWNPDARGEFHDGPSAADTALRPGTASDGR
jgi:hypothetical protein